MKDRFNGQEIWERDIERSPMRYAEDACWNCGYRSRPSRSKDVCRTCIFRHRGREIYNINK